MARLTGIVLLALGLLGRVAAAEPEMRLSPHKLRDEVRAVVEGQLAALRAGEFSQAYGFAAAGIKRQFDVRLFALLIKRGYPALLKPGDVDFGVVRDNGGGTAQVVVTLTDALKRNTIYRFWLVREQDNWRISGVVLEQRPRRGDI